MYKFNICITTREKEKSDGSYQLVLRINVKGKAKYFPVGYDVLKKDFDFNKQLVKRTDTRFHEKNLAISNANSKAINIENYFLAKKMIPTLESFARRYQGIGENQDSFYDFTEMHLKRHSKRFSEGTKDFYRKHIGKLKKFAPSLTFGEINIDFLYDYEKYCYSLNNRESTTYKSLEFIRRVLNAALKDDVIEKSPFRNFEIPKTIVKNLFLSLEHVNQLHELYQKDVLTVGQQNVLRYFLFACYTGLRYSDIYNLRHKNIINQGGITFISFVQQKTNKFTLVPIIDQATPLIPETNFDNAKVFRVTPNQTTNNHLKRIAAYLEWDVRLTFHVARRTCSNLLYQLGIPVEIRSLIVGDTSQVLRDHYTNTDSGMIVDAMSVLSAALKHLRIN